jgi:hypothetical protein
MLSWDSRRLKEVERKLRGSCQWSVVGCQCRECKLMRPILDLQGCPLVGEHLAL